MRAIALILTLYIKNKRKTKEKVNTPYFYCCFNVFDLNKPFYSLFFLLN